MKESSEDISNKACDESLQLAEKAPETKEQVKEQTQEFQPQQPKGYTSRACNLNLEINVLIILNS